MRSEEIEYILEVYKTRSLSKAAEHLSITPQGLGKAVKKVEQELGCVLFQRSFQGVMPTPVCTAIVDQMTNIVSSANEIQRIISDFNNQSEAPEYLLAMESVLGSKVEQILHHYNELYSKNVQIELRPMTTEDSFEVLFEQNNYDYRLCTKELIRNDIYETYQIARLHFHPIVNAGCPLCQKTSISIEDFNGMTFVVESNRPYAQRFEELCRQNGVRLKTQRAYDKFYFARLLSEHDDYIYLRQRADIDRMMRLGNFVLLYMEPAFETNIVLQSRSGNIDPRLLNLIRIRLSSFSDQYLD